LAGRLAAYRHPELPEEIASPARAASLPSGTRLLAQPRSMRPGQREGSWWDYSGPLMLVFNGGPASKAGELVLPVRLPQGRAAGPTWSTIWIARGGGTKSTWCGGGMPRPKAAGPTKPT